MAEQPASESGQGQRTAVYDTPGVLCRFTRPRMVIERCGLCRVVVSDEHTHLIELANREIVCSCGSCAVLFGQGAPDPDYRRIPDRILYLSEFQLSDAIWESLLIPNGVAFFVNNSQRRSVIVLYPGPTGPTESLLTPASWKEMLDQNPVLQRMEPDTEALLVNRMGRRKEEYLVPIDQCYRLGEIVRQNWRGLAGGTEVCDAVNKFLVTLKDKATLAGEAGQA